MLGIFNLKALRCKSFKHYIFFKWLTCILDNLIGVSHQHDDSRNIYALKKLDTTLCICVSVPHWILCTLFIWIASDSYRCKVYINCIHLKIDIIKINSMFYV